MAHRLAPQAANDLDDIWYDVARESGSTDRADRLIDALTERFFLLSTYPQLGRRRDDDLRPGLRSLAVEGYVIIYRVTTDSNVLILRIPHGRKDLPAITQQDAPP